MNTVTQATPARDTMQVVRTITPATRKGQFTDPTNGANVRWEDDLLVLADDDSFPCENPFA